MGCAEVRDRLSWYIDRELDEHTLELIEAHLCECCECRRELAFLETIVEASTAVEQIDAPSELKSAILKAARRSDECKPVVNLLPAYSDGELSAAQREIVATHLENCQYCAEEVRMLRRLVSAASEIEPVEPPATLRARIRASTTGGELAPQPLLQRLWQTAGIRWAGGAVAAAGAVAVLAVMLVAPQSPKPTAVTRPSEPAPRVANEGALSRTPAVAAPVPASTSPPADTIAVAGHSRPTRAAMKREPNRPVEQARPHVAKLPKPAPRALDRPDPTEIAVTSELEAREIELEEVADAPKPAPVIRAEEHKPAKPALTKVASAPAVTADDTEAFIDSMKAKAAMRKGSASGGLQVFSTKF